MSGLITINHEWRVIYEVAAALVGFVLLLAFFTFPETAYARDDEGDSDGGTTTDTGEKQQEEQRQQRLPTSLSSTGTGATKTTTATTTTPIATTTPAAHGAGGATTRAKKTYLQTLAILPPRPLTRESLLHILLRPIGLIVLPPVLWAALVQSVTIGFLVAVTSNVAPAFQATYGFQPWQVGLCFVAAVVGSLLGIPAGGHLGDLTADWFTKRNGGVRDPEMRLPAMVLCLVTAPLALVLYGVGIKHRLHWMCPTVGLGLCEFDQL